MNNVNDFLKNHTTTVLQITLGLFLVNQILEWMIITLFGFSYLKLCDWDCLWYATIASSGYDTASRALIGGKANWAFFPVFPYLVKCAHWLLTHLGMNISLQSSIVLTSKTCFLISIFTFIKFGLTYFPYLNPLLLGSIVALNPFSLFGNTGYTEPLFLLMSCLFLMSLKKQKYISAGICAGILSAVRSTGITSIILYSLFALPKLYGHNQGQKPKIVLGFILAPTGIILFMFLLYYQIGDPLAFFHIQKAWGRALSNPSIIITHAIGKNILHQYWAMTTIGALLCATFFVIKKQVDLALFIIICTLVPASTGTLWSIPRFIWWQAPILLALSIFITWRKLWVGVFPIFITGLVYTYTLWFAHDISIV